MRKFRTPVIPKALAVAAEPTAMTAAGLVSSKALPAATNDLLCRLHGLPDQPLPIAGTTLLCSGGQSEFLLGVRREPPSAGT